MNAGLMDVLVSLQSYTETIDTNTGEKLQTWTEYATAWAQRVEQESGAENVNADRREHCLLYTSPSPRDGATSRMPSSA